MTGFMGSLDMRPVARGTGRAGTVQPPNSFVLVVSSTMKILMPVTGQKMFRDARSIVINTYNFPIIKVFTQ